MKVENGEFTVECTAQEWAEFLSSYNAKKCCATTAQVDNTVTQVEQQVTVANPTI